VTRRPNPPPHSNTSCTGIRESLVQKMIRAKATSSGTSSKRLKRPYLFNNLVRVNPPISMHRAGQWEAHIPHPYRMPECFGPFSACPPESLLWPA